MPAGYKFPQTAELWTPLQLDPSKEVRDNRYLQAVARLKPGVTLAQAQAQMDTLAARLAADFAETNGGWSARLTGLQDQLVGNVRASLLVLLGAVALVLLITCANVANLQLARAASRRKNQRPHGPGRVALARHPATADGESSALGHGRRRGCC